jgi:hypothetical protein
MPTPTTSTGTAGQSRCAADAATNSNQQMLALGLFCFQFACSGDSRPSLRRTQAPDGRLPLHARWNRSSHEKKHSENDKSSFSQTILSFDIIELPADKPSVLDCLVGLPPIQSTDSPPRETSQDLPAPTPCSSKPPLCTANLKDCELLHKDSRPTGAGHCRPSGSSCWLAALPPCVLQKCLKQRQAMNKQLQPPRNRK